MTNRDPFADLLRSLEDNLEDDGGWIPPDEPPRRTQPSGNPRRILWIVIPILLLIFFNRLVSFYTDYIWYDSLGLSDVFVTRLYASLGLFVVSTLVFWLFLAVNVWVARRLAPRMQVQTPLEEFAAAIGLRVSTFVLVAGAILALIMGLSASGAWETVLLYLNQQPMNLTDPLFGRDISFFFFTLPLWQGLWGWLLFMQMVTLAAVGLVAGLGWRGWRVGRGVLAHLAVLAGLILLMIAWQYRLNALQLVYSHRGTVFGASYADVHAQLPVYNILSVVTVLTAVLLVVTVFVRRAWRAMVGVLAIWLVIAVLAGNIYPGLVQRFQVNPNELNLERPYIEDNIAFTRAAYGVDSIQELAYEVEPNVTAEELLSEAQTVRNVRLWDYRPLGETYNQIQALRQYYHFNDIDVDRYMINGELRQVMLGARELVPEQLSSQAQTWVNRRLVYTHGYGVAASPVSQVTRDGLPDFFVKDLPPTGVITVTRPQIYFGELPGDYVIGNTTEAEFDYPSGDANVTTRFAAETGISMNWATRLIYTIRFADINLLLNRDITAESQLLWRRNIITRISEVAPFLHFDQDPYIVVDDAGHLKWIVDAYTVSDRFPYSEPVGSLNYIRNSVKIVVDAYDGSMHFFVTEPDEPIIAAYQRIFPSLFTSFDQMPPGLLRHIRYPSDLFTVQAEIYRTYHMTNATEFYNREDMWAWPEEIFQDRTQRIEPYYVLMQLPGSAELEYVQILPYTPANRENMIAWLAARSDPEGYGEKLVYEFGKDTLFFGPKQVEARIDQDPVISAQLALWNQQGSSVIRGNLLVFPVAQTLIYVEPLYLQSASGRIPELQRVIVATADEVSMAENLGLALANIFGEQVLEDAGLAELATFGGAADVEEVLSEAAAGGVLGQSATIEQLIVQANEQFNRAQQAAQSGDWATYGEQIAALQATLQALAEQTGLNPSPTPQPDAQGDESPALDETTGSSDVPEATPSGGE